MINNKTALITVTYNSSSMVTQFSKVASIFSTVIVVDNGSKDESISLYGLNVAHAQIVRLKKNVGYGAANNLGLELSRRLGCTYSLLLNPDCFIDEPSVTKLLRALEAFGDVGAVNPRIVSGGGGEPTVTLFDFTRPYVEKVSTRLTPKHADNSTIHFDAVINGSCVLVRQSAFASIGYFSEDLFLFEEEDDVSIRLRRAGFRTALIGEAYATHLGGKSSSPSLWLLLMKSYHRRWSKLWMLDRYVSRSRRIREAVMVALISPMAISMYALLIQPKNVVKWAGWSLAALDGILLTKKFRSLLT